ncbi:SpoIIE family protein phosphatase [Paracoccus sp. YIM 132242]|uniref:SpoIIE family protein phosphatase n=1 Tax=Paracoccus lichenicola TaxID=2665644 RepID=A0A6L6HRV6_9RHOB|nr:SpoIIE family protein phosphatase [Paracoccus lichenicola]MTE01081.1 SpoIIE family protein phosphatase [Paracoccus lichenicola]
MPLDQDRARQRQLSDRVVIADDDATQRIFASTVISRIGFTPVLARDGLEALEMIERSGASILVCDLDMPGIDGHEVTRRIRAADLGRYIHVVMLTAAGQAEQRRLALEAGVDDFMTKPLDAAMLTARIRAAARLVDHEQALSDKNRALQLAKRRIEHDLNVAAEAQRRLLPGPTRDIGGCRFGTAFQPSAYVSGDMFGYYPLPGDRLGFYAVDVAGHGVHAALLSVAIGHLVTAQYFAGQVGTDPGAPDPAAMVRDLNGRFYRRDGTDYFTMFCGVLDQRDGRLSFCQAGYPSPILARRDGTTAVVGDGGFPVGLLNAADFHNGTIDLGAGETLVLCSDGAIEAEGPDDAPFGEDRLRGLVAGHGHEDVEALPGAIVAALAQWRNGRPLEDDLTVLALARSPSA